MQKERETGDVHVKPCAMPRITLALIICATAITLLQPMAGAASHELVTVAKKPQEKKGAKPMEYWLEFEILKYVRGRSYFPLRERLLKHQPLELEGKLASVNRADWQTAAMYHIILGWIRNKGIYDTVMTNLYSENVASARKSAVGMDSIYEKYRLLAKRHGEKVLPLAWEYVLKFDDNTDLWRHIAMMYMMAEIPHPLSIESLLWVIENTSQGALRDAAATSLVRIADKQTIKRIIALRVKHRAIADVLSEIVEENPMGEVPSIPEDDEDGYNGYKELFEEDPVDKK